MPEIDAATLAAVVRIAETPPDMEVDTNGTLACPFCDGQDDGQEWMHADSCPWLVLYTDLPALRDPYRPHHGYVESAPYPDDTGCKICHRPRANHPTR